MLIDRVFRTTCLAFAGFTILLVTFIVLRIAISAAPAISRYGLGFLTGRVWDPNTERYGILAEIWGTLYTSVLALVLGTRVRHRGGDLPERGLPGAGGVRVCCAA